MLVIYGFIKLQFTLSKATKYRNNSSTDASNENY